MRDESDVEATRRVRDSVLANISHEFRTPLSAQLASAGDVARQAARIASQEVHDLVLSVERGTLRLTQLIDNLLESTRIEAARMICVASRSRSIKSSRRRSSSCPADRAARANARGKPAYPLPPITGDGPRLGAGLREPARQRQQVRAANSTIRIAGSVGETDCGCGSRTRAGLPDGADDAIFHRFTRSAGAEPEAGGMGWVSTS